MIKTISKIKTTTEADGDVTTASHRMSTIKRKTNGEADLDSSFQSTRPSIAHATISRTKTTNITHTVKQQPNNTTKKQLIPSFYTETPDVDQKKQLQQPKQRKIFHDVPDNIENDMNQTVEDYLKAQCEQQIQQLMQHVEKCIDSLKRSAENKKIDLTNSIIASLPAITPSSTTEALVPATSTTATKKVY